MRHDAAFVSINIDTKSSTEKKCIVVQTITRPDLRALELAGQDLPDSG
jgi:hypothetical protein